MTQQLLRVIETDLQKVLRRGKQRDTLGEKIEHALGLINAVLDQLGSVLLRHQPLSADISGQTA